MPLQAAAPAAPPLSLSNWRCCALKHETKRRRNEGSVTQTKERKRPCWFTRSLAMGWWGMRDRGNLSGQLCLRTPSLKHRRCAVMGGRTRRSKGGSGKGRLRLQSRGGVGGDGCRGLAHPPRRLVCSHAGYFVGVNENGRIDGRESNGAVVERKTMW